MCIGKKGGKYEKVFIKQDNITANDTPRVLTNTGTAGEYGTKGIYDANGEYAAQQNALIDAATMNTAVQNAIDSEFQCISWLDDDPTKDCLLMDVFGTTTNGGTTLPNGYTALEYIESTGSQYIDTNYIPNNLTNFEIRYLHTGWLSFVDIPYGCTNEPNPYKANYGLFRTNRTYNRMAWGNDSNRTNVDLPSHFASRLDKWYTDKYLQNNMYINGVLVATADVSADVIWNAAGTIYLFKRNSSDAYPSKARIAYVKIWENGRIIKNFIPARRDSDGEIGMYDMVSRTFFENAGTGEFIGGPVVNLYLPAGQ